MASLQARLHLNSELKAKKMDSGDYKDNKVVVDLSFIKRNKPDINNQRSLSVQRNERINRVVERNSNSLVSLGRLNQNQTYDAKLFKRQ